MWHLVGFYSSPLAFKIRSSVRSLNIGKSRFEVGWEGNAGEIVQRKRNKRSCSRWQEIVKQELHNLLSFLTILSVTLKEGKTVWIYGSPKLRTKCGHHDTTTVNTAFKAIYPWCV